MLGQFDNQPYYSPVFGLHNASTGQFRTLSLSNAGYYGYSFATWAAWNSRGSFTEPSVGPDNNGPIWAHLKSDGTTASYGWSRDGATPFYAYNEAYSVLIGTATHLFFGMFAQASHEVVGLSNTILCVDPNGGSRVMG